MIVRVQGHHFGATVFRAVVPVTFGVVVTGIALFVRMFSYSRR